MEMVSIVTLGILFWNVLAQTRTPSHSPSQMETITIIIPSHLLAIDLILSTTYDACLQADEVARPEDS